MGSEMCIRDRILIVTFKFKREHFGLALLGFLALLSHPLMDCFQAYTPILYPILDRSIWINIEGKILLSTELLTPKLSAAVKDAPTIFKPFEKMDAPIFTSEGFFISLMLLAPTLIINLKPSRSIHSDLPHANADDPSENIAVTIPHKPLLKADDITVVLPTLDEKEAIGRVIDELRSEGYYNILVVDGGSNDETVEIAEKKGVKVILQYGKGKAGAIRTAIEYVDTPYMLVMDADYTYDPRDIKKMLTSAPELDEVIGLRMDKENIPWMHRIGNRIISFTLSLLLGQMIHDPCSGMYLLKTESARILELTSGGFDVEAEIAAQMCSYGRVAEVPISYRKRLGNRKIKLRDGFKILATIIRVAWLYNPIFIFSALTALFTVPGAAILLWQLTLRYLYGAERWSIGWSWLGLILLIVGIQGFTIATIALLLKRMERRIINAQKRRANEP